MMALKESFVEASSVLKANVQYIKVQGLKAAPHIGIQLTA